MERLREVVRPSGRDRLVTGRVKVVCDPSKNDGMTRLSREKMEPEPKGSKTGPVLLGWFGLAMGPTWLGERPGEARVSIGRAFDLCDLLERRIINVRTNAIAARKPVLLDLDARSEVSRFRCPIVCLRDLLHALARFMPWAEYLAHRPRLKIGNRRRPGNPQSEFSQCSPSVLMCPETAAISVCRKRAPNVCRGTFETILTLLGRPWQVAWSEPK
ncbi:hypothetical protein CRG98_011638 [Punica granatum]|uniref:Uncharacterized protein n=1 Tax=Punica granatum TaxID=22663 RepID=A0A2I0KHN8_PUNGR|nr:hypothetical protein CRG98_011638 [Punica granatum]